LFTFPEFIHPDLITLIQEKLSFLSISRYQDQDCTVGPEELNDSPRLKTFLEYYCILIFEAQDDGSDVQVEKVVENLLHLGFTTEHRYQTPHQIVFRYHF
jgi:hypothetical protein